MRIHPRKTSGVSGSGSVKLSANFLICCSMETGLSCFRSWTSGIRISRTIYSCTRCMERSRKISWKYSLSPWLIRVFLIQNPTGQRNVSCGVFLHLCAKSCKKQQDTKSAFSEGIDRLRGIFFLFAPCLKC